MKELIKKIKEYHTGEYYHRKRGFRFADISAMDSGLHMIEEAVELVAEVSTGTDP